jgi:hypothetical protein
MKNAKRTMLTLSFSLYTVRMRIAASGNNANWQASTIDLLRIHTPRLRNLVCLAALATLPVSIGLTQQSMQTGGMVPSHPANTQETWRPMLYPSSTQHSNPEDTPEQAALKRAYQKRLELLNLQRHEDMTSETEKLVALANQLKSETDHSSKQTPLMESVRQAEQIAKLAHSVREKMKATVGN